jgi:hypothetical protein
MGTELRELTIDELDTVSGAVKGDHVVEFKMGLIRVQLDVKCGGGTLWNGDDPIEIPK